MTVAVVLAAVSALVWGSADYCGGRATQRISALTVTLASQVIGLPIVLLCVVLIPGAWYASDLAWGAGAGAAGLFGIVLLYRGLSTGAMTVVAPITAVTGAVIPLAAGLLTERAPSALALGGVACAILAIGLVSLHSPHPHGPPGAATNGGGGPARWPEAAGMGRASIVGTALASGAMFGIFFVLLSQTHSDAGMWPLVALRGASMGLGLVLLLRRGLTLALPRPVAGWVAAAGFGDIAANALYLLATREGLLSIIAPIAALYPVSTVLLALSLDKERVRPIQLAGLGLAATALVLTAV